MSPEDFRKISHPEPKILNSLVNWWLTHRHTDTHTGVNLELTPPEVGQLKNIYISYTIYVVRGKTYYEVSIDSNPPISFRGGYNRPGPSLTFSSFRIASTRPSSSLWPPSSTHSSIYLWNWRYNTNIRKHWSGMRMMLTAARDIQGAF